MLESRKSAGLRLAKKLGQYGGKDNVLVLGIPRGGVEVAYEIAKKLNLKLDVIIIKKIGAPGNEELALGAVGVDDYFLNQDIVRNYNLSKMQLNDLIKKNRLRLGKDMIF